MRGNKSSSVVLCTQFIGENLEVEYLVHEAESPKQLLILMPAALDPSRSDRRRTIFSRRTWVSEWADIDVLVFSDPAVKLDERLNGAWFIHPEVDILKEIGKIVTDHAARRKITSESILIYGSSLGGFGALALATETGGRAIAEVPQVDFRHWQARAKENVENYLLGESIDRFVQSHPERVSVLHRMVKQRFIPQFEIVTNPLDPCFEHQLRFLKWVQSADLPKSGVCKIQIRDDLKGHAVLNRLLAVDQINRTLLDMPMAPFR